MAGSLMGAVAGQLKNVQPAVPALQAPAIGTLVANTSGSALAAPVAKVKKSVPDGDLVPGQLLPDVTTTPIGTGPQTAADQAAALQQYQQSWMDEQPSTGI